VRVRDEFLRLRDEHRLKKVRMDAAERSTEPDIKKVGEVRVANVIVVWRVGGNEKALVSPTRGICLEVIPSMTSVSDVTTDVNPPPYSSSGGASAKSQVI
jgi:hypothetical protein